VSLDDVRRVDASRLFGGQTARNMSLVSRRMPPTTHCPSTNCLLLYFLFRNLLSSISTLSPAPPINVGVWRDTVSRHTSLQNDSQSAVVSELSFVGPIWLWNLTSLYDCAFPAFRHGIHWRKLVSAELTILLPPKMFLHIQKCTVSYSDCWYSEIQQKLSASSVVREFQVMSATRTTTTVLY